MLRLWRCYNSFILPSPKSQSPPQPLARSTTLLHLVTGRNLWLVAHGSSTCRLRSSAPALRSARFHRRYDLRIYPGRSARMSSSRSLFNLAISVTVLLSSLAQAQAADSIPSMAKPYIQPYVARTATKWRTDPGDQPRHQFVKGFDNKGRLIDCLDFVSFNGGGAAFDAQYLIQYSYDGNEATVRKYDSKMILKQKSVYLYDRNGKLLKVSNYRPGEYAPYDSLEISRRRDRSISQVVRNAGGQKSLLPLSKNQLFLKGGLKGSDPFLKGGWFCLWSVFGQYD